MVNRKKICTFFKKLFLYIKEYNLWDFLVDHYYDWKYGVKTCKKDALEENDKLYYNYEPSRYRSLHELFKKYGCSENDHLVDFGCGKGRVIAIGTLYQYPMITGIEINKIMFDIAYKNIEVLKKREPMVNIELKLMDAKDFNIPVTATHFFFFNPFHLKIFIYVLRNITKSVMQHPREIKLFFLKPHSLTIDYIQGSSIYQLIENNKSHGYFVYALKTENINSKILSDGI